MRGGGSVSHQSEFIACYLDLLGRKCERRMILHKINPDQNQNGHTLSIKFYKQPMLGLPLDPFSEYEGTLKFHHHDVSFPIDKVTIKGKYYTTGNKNERGGNRTRTITGGNNEFNGFGNFQDLKVALQAKVLETVHSKDELARMYNEQQMPQTRYSPTSPDREWSSGTSPTTTKFLGPSDMAFAPPHYEGNHEEGYVR